MKKIGLVLLLTIVFRSGIAQIPLQPQLFKDLNLAMDPFMGGNPSGFTTVNGITYFIASTNTDGRELWKTDGTTLGTMMVKDIFPGSGSSNPGELIGMNNTLYFTANNGTEGTELWKSDGTLAGTVMVKDIRPGLNGSSPASLTVLNGTLLFSAHDGGTAFGKGLWKSDGTATGTTFLNNLGLGSSSVILAKIVMADTAYFFTDTDLWRSDGSVSGTSLVANTPSSYTYRTPMLSSGGYFYFQTYLSSNLSLWKSNGTPAGTTILKSISPPIGSIYLTGFNFIGSTLYFSSWNGLYKSDGTVVGTVLVKTLNIYTDVVKANGLLFFSSEDGTNGRELWKSDGTNLGTVLVKDISPGIANSLPSELMNISDTLYFKALIVGSWVLYKSDGTSSGTVALSASVAGSPIMTMTMANYAIFGTSGKLWKSNGTSAGSDFIGPLFIDHTDFYYNAGTLFFAGHTVNGKQLWKTDGTHAGTVLVKDINQATSSSHPNGPKELNGNILFNANSSLWRTDGTDTGTYSISSTPLSFYNAISGGNIFFIGNLGTELWKTNGTSTGTTMVKAIAGGAIGEMVDLNGTVFFAGNDGTTGLELWKSDGTTLGTSLVKEIYLFSNGSYPYGLTNVNGTLFFGANDGLNGYELWKSDGTFGGTVMVKDIFASGSFSSNPSNLIAYNNLLYFVANDGTNGNELWRSDGTSGGTFMVKDINPTSGAAGNSLITKMTVHNGSLYFYATDGTNGVELWKSDGTASGTSMVVNINPSTINSTATLSLPFVMSVDTNLFFWANDGINGEELWKTNGTAAGTVLVQDVLPGVNSGAAMVKPKALNINNALYFDAGGVAAANSRFWKSDGTNCGTFAITDLLTGSINTILFNKNNKVMFNSTRVDVGSELFYIDISSVPAAGASTAITTQPASQAFCEGSIATLSVAAAGEDLTYQWKKGTTNVGTNSPSLVINSVSFADTGTYTVTISGSCGSNPVVSNAVVLSVNSVPVITTQPASMAACDGGTAFFKVVATGTGLTYQWQERQVSGSYLNLSNGGIYSGALSDMLLISNATSAMVNYQYRCIVTGINTCSTTSSAGYLTTYSTPPVIGTQPVDVYKCTSTGTSVSFNVVVNAPPTGLTYQWQQNSGSGFVNINNGGIYTNATTATLNMNGITTAMSGYQYQCVVGTCSPSVITDTATLFVYAVATITAQPQNLTVCEGMSATFSITTSATNVTYQWQESLNNGGSYSNVSNTGNFSGTDTPTLTISSTVVPSGNNPRYRCVLTTGTCTVNSLSAVLTVRPLPLISLQPVDKTICSAEFFTLNLSASNAFGAYQWQVNSGAGFANLMDTGVYSGSNGPTLTISAAPVWMNGNQYRCIVGSCFPEIISDTSVITVNEPPAVTSQPLDQEICTGENTTYSIAATGTNIAYLWYYNSTAPLSDGTYFSGTTTNTLNVIGASNIFNNYTFSCRVAGACQFPTYVYSDDAVLHVSDHVIPAITQTNGTLNSNITGGYTYQWIDCNNGNAAITGETNQTFTPSGGGNFAVIVTKFSCSDTSSCFLFIGIEESLQLEKISISPNPAREMLYIQNISEKTEITILDPLGRIIYTVIADQAISIDLSEFDSGLYFIKLNVEGYTRTERLIKIK